MAAACALMLTVAEHEEDDENDDQYPNVILVENIAKAIHDFPP